MRYGGKCHYRVYVPGQRLHYFHKVEMALGFAVFNAQGSPRIVGIRIEKWEPANGWKIILDEAGLAAFVPPPLDNPPHP